MPKNGGGSAKPEPSLSYFGGPSLFGQFKLTPMVTKEIQTKEILGKRLRQCNPIHRENPRNASV